MKFITTVLLLVIMIASNFHLIKGDEDDCGLIAMLELEAIAQCSEIHQISREAVEGILHHEYVLDDHEVKCWLSCVLTQLVVIKEDKMDWDHFKHLIKHCLDNADDRAKVDVLIWKCKAEVPETQSDVCELAYSAAVCKINTWKKLDLP